MENDPQIIRCPICESLETAFFCHKNSFDLHTCLVCRHVFIFPFYFETAEVYGEDYFVGAESGSGYADYDKDKEPMRPVFVKYVRKIEHVSNKRGKLLDVGAATGFFVGIANELGWEGHGLEISPYAAHVAKGKGLQVHCGTLDSVSFEKENFDSVTAWDVLEHLPNPTSDLRTIHSLLKEGGVLAINTPDSGSLLARLMGKRWHLLIPPEHVHYFTNKSIMVLLEQSGFKVEEIGRIGKTFTLEYIFSILTGWLKLDVLSQITAFLKARPKIGSVAIPINLHDNMFIIARKIKL